MRDAISSRFCADVSRAHDESLSATASRVDNWILVEYRGLWARDAVAASGLSAEVKQHLRERAHGLRPAKVLFVRRRARQGSRDGATVLWGSSRPGEEHLSSCELESYEDLLDLDLASPGEPVGHPLLLVCTHGKHDRCCARLGRPLHDAIREQVEPDWVWQASHLGGDRFAGNLVCLPEGLYFGRVEPADVWPVLDAYLARHIHLPLYRGRSAYPARIQAAELAVREASGRSGLDDVRVVSTEPIRLAAGGRVYEAVVVEQLGEAAGLTCGAGKLTRPRRFVVESLRESGA